MINRILILGFFVLLNVSYCVRAQSSLARASIQVYNSDNGLPNNSVQKTFQDKQGFIWISTAEALVRFDGINFRYYYPNQKDASAVSGSSWFSFKQAPNGDIWMTHNRGISIYSPYLNNFKNILYCEGAFDLKNALLGMDHKGYLWALIAGKGLVKININTRKVELIKKLPIPEFYRANYYAVATGVLIDKMIYFSVLGKSYKYNIELDKFAVVFKDPLDIRCIVPLGNSKFLYGGFNCLFLEHQNRIQGLNVKDSLPDKAANILYATIIPYTDSTMLAGGGGFLKEISLNTFKTRQRVTNFEKIPDQKAMYVSDLMKDSFNNIWVSCNGLGLIKIPYNKKEINHYPTPDGNSEVKSIRATSRFLFTGYFINGISVYDRGNKLLKHHKFNVWQSTKKGFNKSVYAMEIIDTNRLFVSLDYNSASGVYNFRTDEYTDLSDEISRLKPFNYYVTSLYKFTLKLRNGTILFSHDDNIFSYHYVNKKHRIVLFSEIKNQTLTTAYEDKLGNIWIGTMQNLYFAKPGSAVFQKIPLPGEQTIKSIAQSKSGEYWIACVNGIYVLNSNGKLSSIYNRQTGMKSDYVYSVLPDSNDNVWFSTNSGIGRVDVSNREFRFYSVEDGLQGNEFNTNAYYQSNDGELFFGGGKGVNSFYPGNMANNQKPATCAISEMKVGDETFQPDSAIWVKKQLNLNYLDNTLSFTFFSNDFKRPENTLYSYYLEGYEGGWIQNGNNTFIRYPNLPPGEYHLKYKCTNGDGIWSENISNLRITIFPPWYQTKWALAMFILAGLGSVLFSFYLFVKNRDKRQRLKLEEFQRIQEERNRISRDLHDNVGSMVSFVSTKLDWIVKNRHLEGDTKEHLNLVKENAHEIMHGLRDTIWTLNQEQISNTDLADKLKVYAKAHLIVPITIHDEIEEEQVLTGKVVLSIYRCCQEIFNNINKHSQAKAVVLAFTGNTKVPLKIMIKDDGTGITEQEMDKANHFGIRNIKSRLTEAGVEFMIETGTKMGTTFTITCS